MIYLFFWVTFVELCVFLLQQDGGDLNDIIMGLFSFQQINHRIGSKPVDPGTEAEQEKFLEDKARFDEEVPLSTLKCLLWLAEVANRMVSKWNLLMSFQSCNCGC